MAEQWRVPCEECGKREIDYLRMHSQLTGTDKFRAEDELGINLDDYSAVVECNVCENRRPVE